MMTDVVVVGGGPAGSTLAALLVKQGLSTMVVERSHFPRHHVGESLVPQVLDVLEISGALPAVESAGFLRKEGGVFVWGRRRVPWSFYFDEAAYRYDHTYAYQVVRSEFDSLLLEHARKCGAETLQGVEARELLGDSPGRPGEAQVRVLLRGADGQARSVACRFVADCSGLRGWLATRSRWRRYDPALRNVAFYSYWRGCDRLPGRDENSILCEAVPQGWIWSIPLHTGETSVGFVTRAQLARAGKPLDLYSSAMTSSTYLRPLLRHAGRCKPLRAVADYSYSSTRLTGDAFLLAGDAAGFIDPVWSTGVLLAVNSAQLAATAITRLLNEGDSEALEEYERKVTELYVRYREFVHFFYGAHQDPEGYFWKARQLMSDNLDMRDAFIRLVSGRLGCPIGD